MISTFWTSVESQEMPYEKNHRDLRKKQKKAVDTVLVITNLLLEWPDEDPLSKADFWQQTDEQEVLEARKDLREFKKLEERGYGDLLLGRYSSLRKYFAQFLHLPLCGQTWEHRLNESHSARAQTRCQRDSPIPHKCARRLCP